MQTFTPFEYLLIDIANQFGLDKEVFDDRIQWVKNNFNDLEALAEQKGEWKEKPLYLKAVQALRKVCQGEPTGHLVGFDAICSGMQIMSAMTGCESGAAATGLIDTGERPDAYTQATDIMAVKLGSSMNVLRKDVKQAVMTMLYGSRQQPKILFGEGTPELAAFYESVNEMAPGAVMLLNLLLDSWRPFALSHQWKLPDGYDARVKVMQKQELRIEVDELDHARFTYEYYENVGTESGLSNVANVVHSVDAYILRCLERRCNYDSVATHAAYDLLLNEAIRREMGGSIETPVQVSDADELFWYYVQQFNRSTVPDVIILKHLTRKNVRFLNQYHLDKLTKLAGNMVSYKPFPIVTVHDEFKCHPNNMNYLRFQYKETLADIAESELITDLLQQVYEVDDVFHKLTPDLSQKIRQSNYSLT